MQVAILTKNPAVVKVVEEFFATDNVLTWDTSAWAKFVWMNDPIVQPFTRAEAEENIKNRYIIAMKYCKLKKIVTDNIDLIICIESYIEDEARYSIAKIWKNKENISYTGVSYGLCIEKNIITRLRVNNDKTIEDINYGLYQKEKTNAGAFTISVALMNVYWKAAGGDYKLKSVESRQTFKKIVACLYRSEPYDHVICIGAVPSYAILVADALNAEFTEGEIPADTEDYILVTDGSQQSHELVKDICLPGDTYVFTMCENKDETVEKDGKEYEICYTTIKHYVHD